MQPKLDDTIVIEFTTKSPTTGGFVDADSTPTCKVREDTTATPILTPTVAKVTGEDGLYEVSIPCTAANGFEADKSYNVLALATVGGVPDKAIVARFQVRSNIVDGYAAGQSPADLILVTPAQKIATDVDGNVSVAGEEIEAPTLDEIGDAVATRWWLNADSLALDAKATAIQAKTDQFVFTTPNKVDATASTTLGATAPAGWINTAAFAVGATLPRVTLADTLTTYTGNTPQTGDSFVRMGANGSSLTALATQVSVNTLATYVDTEIAAILAAVDTEIATILANSARIPASPAAVGDIPTTSAIVTAWNADAGVIAMKGTVVKLESMTEAGEGAGISRYTGASLVNAPAFEGEVGAVTIDWGQVVPTSPTTGTHGAAARAVIDNLDATVGSRATPLQVNEEASQAIADVGLTLARTAFLDATISSRSTFAGGAVASVTAPVTVGTNNDKTSYSLAIAPPTAAQNLAAILANANFVQLFADAFAARGTTDALATTIELDGLAWRFTAAALENGPAGGEGGAADWTVTEKGQIRHRLGLDGSTVTPAATPNLGGMTLADGAITSAKFTVAAASAGPASGLLEKIDQVWRRLFKRGTKTSAQLLTFADDNVTVLTTQQVSNDGTTEVQGPAT